MKIWLALLVLTIAVHHNAAVDDNEIKEFGSKICQDSKGDYGKCKAKCLCDQQDAEVSDCKDGDVCCVAPCRHNAGDPCNAGNKKVGTCSADCIYPDAIQGDCQDGKKCCLETDCLKGIGAPCAYDGICSIVCGEGASSAFIFSKDSRYKSCPTGLSCCEPDEKVA